MAQITRSLGIVGNPRLGRTTKVVRIPAEFDHKILCDLYILMAAHLDGRREELRSGSRRRTRDWTHYDRLLIEVADILDSAPSTDCNR
jgi:hypothetical protein